MLRVDPSLTPTLARTLTRYIVASPDGFAEDVVSPFSNQVRGAGQLEP